MPASTAKNLSSLFRTAVKTTTNTAATATATTTSSSSFSTPAQDATLKHFVSSLDTSSSPTASISNFIKRRYVKAKSPKSFSSRSTETSFSSSLPILNLDPLSDSEDSTKQLSREISSILSGGESLSSPDLQGADDGEDIVEKVLNIPWFSNLSHNHISLHRKEVSRERKQKWVYKSSQGNRFNRLISMCGQKLGTETTIQVFGKLGRETGVKEYNALIGLCVQRVRRSDDEDAALEQIHMAFRLFESMREQGFQIEEDTYGQFLLYLIEMGMEQEFHFFCGVIGKDNPCSLPRLGYYEMLLWIGVNNEEKIQELCKYIAVDNGGDNSTLRASIHVAENYLLALCESDRKKELLQLLEIVDIMKLSSPNSVANIFRSLGRLSLESSAENFLMAFKNCRFGNISIKPDVVILMNADYEAENISNFISTYVVSIPNLAGWKAYMLTSHVEDVISKFKNFHAKLEVTPSSSSYAELITYCCDSLKVHAALDLVDEMCEVGLTLSIEVLHSILHATEESCEFNLFEGAYGMLEDLEKMNLTPTANMYNAIMAGYFREVEDVISKFKNFHAKLEVTPSSSSYAELITYCCDSLKVHAALDLVDEMCEVGLTLSIEVLHSILHATEESCEFNLFEGAYGMLEDLEKMNLTPTANMYNAIMAGYFREKNTYGALMVLRKMELADVKPDSQTFSYLISNCDREEDIIKYYEELKHFGVQVTRQIFMALINAYANCGQFEKAKQVVSNKGIPVKNLNEIKSVLVSALASHGQMSDALDIYEEIKQSGSNLEPKAVISLMEHLQSDGELSRLLQLFEELKDVDYWVDGCCRLILYCVRYKHLSSAVDLLKQLKDNFCNDDMAMEVLFDEYYEELKHFGVQVTRQIFMALINAYANCGQFEKAKQVVSNKGIPVKNLNEIKSVLVSALASHGQMSDALDIYEEIKQSGSNLEPKAVISLMVFSQVGESESTHLQIGLDLLQVIKDELCLSPSRKCLDFLLNACVNAKDLQSSLLIWKEYQAAGLPYNVLSFLRMYQVLLASGEHKAAKILLNKIPKDDIHVRCVIKACQTSYISSKSTKGKKKNKVKRKG
ncbi:pentatricopeptide repeat-containing protein [Quercus suber]|uniref:Pentatricopeptide repeat-containing protein n=1 Tax=Quercus suber TaxID=58331 RepID=A0AAW0M299_QUESU